MSRGLGWLQRRVLAYLDDHGGWGWAFELALDLADEREGPSSRGVEVSVRRAVHTLERRGAVRTGYQPFGEEWEPRRPLTLLVWLPRAAQPVQDMCTPRRRWVDEDAKALGALRGIGQEDVDAWWAHVHAAHSRGRASAWEWSLPPAQPPWVPYGLARARVADALLARDENGRLCSGGSAAIQRVMIRLRNRGWIELAPPSAHGLRTIVAIRCLNGHEDNARS